jgi:DNA-binding SARP family transcriptional activator
VKGADYRAEFSRRIGTGESVVATRDARVPMPSVKQPSVPRRGRFDDPATGDQLQRGLRIGIPKMHTTNTAVFVCLLGRFQILKMGEPMSMRAGGKAEQLLSCLAMRPQAGVARASLVEQIWPQTSQSLAGQCLNTLIHSLKNQLADALGGQSPIVHAANHYALNFDGGLGVDIIEFESAVDTGHRLLSAGSTAAAIDVYRRALELYRGDLAAGSDISGVLERERLRATCLNTLARLADAHFELADYEQALSCAGRLIAIDPCREDAHRMAMRAYIRMGARAQALRQYQLCRTILADEFDAVPEPATMELFNLIRTDPALV